MEKLDERYQAIYDNPIQLEQDLIAAVNSAVNTNTDDDHKNVVVFIDEKLPNGAIPITVLYEGKETAIIFRLYPKRFEVYQYLGRRTLNMKKLGVWAKVYRASEVVANFIIASKMGDAKESLV